MLALRSWLSGCVILSAVVVKQLILTPVWRYCTRKHKGLRRSPCQLQSAPTSDCTCPAHHLTMEDRFCRGIKPQTLHQLQQALQHRHKLAQQKTESLSNLWRQLGSAISNSNQHVQHSTTNLQLLLDIDKTLLYSEWLQGVFGRCHGYFLDPDMQHFQQLAQSFWQWRNDAVTCHDNGDDWPDWAPSAVVNGKEVTMWFPEVSAEAPWSKDHPIPEFIQPVYSALSGDLTHYIIMFGGIEWLPCTGAASSEILDIYCTVSVVPAEITILTSLRYELAEAVDALRPTRNSTCNSVDKVPSGQTHVDMYLASCGQREYVHSISSLLETILGCQHASVHGRVFADRKAFDHHQGTMASCRGIKQLAPFNLKDVQDGMLCPRLVVDDQLSVWGVDEQQHKLTLMHVEPWTGRWQNYARAEPQIPVASEADDSHDLSSDADSAAAGAQASSSCRVFSPVITGVLNPPPDGLDRLLAETLQLITQAYVAANKTEPPVFCRLCSAQSDTADSTAIATAPSCSSDSDSQHTADATSHSKHVEDRDVSKTRVTVPAAAAVTVTEAMQATDPAGLSAHMEAEAAASSTAPANATDQLAALQDAGSAMCRQATDVQTHSVVDTRQGAAPEEVTPLISPDCKPAGDDEGVAILVEASKSSSCKRRRLAMGSTDLELIEGSMPASKWPRLQEYS